MHQLSHSKAVAMILIEQKQVKTRQDKFSQKFGRNKKSDKKSSSQIFSTEGGRWLIIELFWVNVLHLWQVINYNEN